MPNDKPNVSWELFCHTKILVALTFHFNMFIEDRRGFRDRNKPMALRIQNNIYTFSRCFVSIEHVISPGRFPKLINLQYIVQQRNISLVLTGYNDVF